MIEAYPLSWPAGYKRTSIRRASRFSTSLARAKDYVKDEISRLDAINPVISTNVPLKRDGDLRADWTKYKMDDHGAAVYFTRNGQPVVLCCDTYTKVWDNLHAIGRTIQALRQIDRDGVSDFLNRTFSGFKALPENTRKEWWIVLQVDEHAKLDEITNAYRRLAKIHHPDAGGSAEEFQKIYNAYNRGMNPHLNT